MSMLPPILNAQALRALSEGVSSQACNCLVGACVGWESVTEDRWPSRQMLKVGSLREASDPFGPVVAEPTFEEFHPEGTRYASPAAPIAVRFFPYNLCDVYACSQCDKVLLRYTEFGGYYVDHRVRELDASLVI